MTWFLVDDGLHAHPKALATSLAALGLWSVAGSWSSRHLTDGFLPDHAIPLLSRGASELADELVATGLWRRVRGGYQFHGDTPAGPDPQICGWKRSGNRRRIPESVRQLVYERDGFRCVECGATTDLSLDHVVPWSGGGSDHPRNLRVLCRSCNCRKGARIVAKEERGWTG